MAGMATHQQSRRGVRRFRRGRRGRPSLDAAIGAITRHGLSRTAVERVAEASRVAPGAAIDGSAKFDGATIGGPLEGAAYEMRLMRNDAVRRVGGALTAGARRGARPIASQLNNIGAASAHRYLRIHPLDFRLSSAEGDIPCPTATPSERASKKRTSGWNNCSAHGAQ